MATIKEIGATHLSVRLENAEVDEITIDMTTDEVHIKQGADCHMIDDLDKYIEVLQAVRKIIKGENALQGKTN